MDENARLSNYKLGRGETEIDSFKSGSFDLLFGQEPKTHFAHNGSSTIWRRDQSRTEPENKSLFKPPGRTVSLYWCTATDQ